MICLQATLNFIDFFGNEETNVADKLKAVKFNLVMKNGDSDLFIKATGSDGKYTFSSTVSQANATDMTLDADGNIHVSGLPQGSYYWKETTTANGYALKTKTDVTVKADKTSKTVVDNQRTSVDKGELVIYKTDESGKKYLSGAKFEITAAEDIVVSGGITIRKKGDIIDTVTTDENGKAVITKDIYQGYSYTVTEIEAPKGYSLNSEPQTVKIATDTADFGTKVSVKNSPWTAPFIITKKNLGGELLPNCEFEILDENKRQITTGITDENGIATFSLGYGKYFYHEIAAPEKYIIDDTLYPFEITEEGVSVYAEMTNYLKEGSIKVTKTTTGNLNVKDIGFIVKGISDTNSDIERELFTDENGEALFENLPIGKYTVTEDGSTVPAAYLVADEQEVTVEYNTTAEVKVTNEEKTGYTIFNAGTHEQLDLHNNTEGNAFVITLQNNDGIKKILAKRVVTGRIRYYDEKLAFNATDNKSLEETIEELVKDYSSNSIVRLTISGSIDASEYQKKEAIYEAQLSRFLDHMIYDNDLSEKITSEKIENEFSEIGFAAKFLKGLLDDPVELQMAYDIVKSLK